MRAREIGGGAHIATKQEKRCDKKKVEKVLDSGDHEREMRSQHLLTFMLVAAPTSQFDMSLLN